MAPTQARWTGSGAEVFAWAMYDWANSAYSTLSITILVGYILNVVVPGDRGPVVWAWGISGSMFGAAVLSPIAGAMADARRAKRRWLGVTALGGAATAILMGLVPPTWPAAIIALFVLTSFFFELSLGFYNGFLPEIADERTMNRVSAWGYALGYLGGALALIVALVVKQYGPELGLPELADQLRAGLVIMGLWWGVFTLPTLWILRDRENGPLQEGTTRALVAGALGRVGTTLRNVRRYHMLALFLLGFLFFNDGVQTVISQASVFADRALGFDVAELVKLILMIQFLALPGACAVGWLADRFGQMPTLLGCLVIWIVLVAAAYFVTTKDQFWVLGVVLAMVMGGTQSVSRAIMGRMTPQARTAEFFGFFNFSGKATSVFGTFLWGAMMWATGSPRLAVVSLLVFFLLGLAITARVNVAEGRRQALADSP
ncbi:MAG: MFS transporter [Pirellulales bacterium]|nr:MFS transporter [Pirellulales bacterium]